MATTDTDTATDGTFAPDPAEPRAPAPGTAGAPPRTVLLRLGLGREARTLWPALDYAGVYEYVAVEPGRECHLRARAMAFELATGAGIKLQVVSVPGDRVLVETGEVRGTTPDWVDLEARVRVPEDASLVRVRVRRERASAPEGPLGGRVWIDAVSLTPARGAA